MASAIRMYGIKNCDSVKKAKKCLEDKSLSYDFVDFKATPPEDKDIKRWLKEFGADKVINKRGTTWRQLNDKDKSKAEGNVSDQVTLIKANPMIIKRPVIESASSKIIGFDQDALKALK